MSQVRTHLGSTLLVTITALRALAGSALAQVPPAPPKVEAFYDEVDFTLHPGQCYAVAIKQRPSKRQHAPKRWTEIRTSGTCDRWNRGTAKGPLGPGYFEVHGAESLEFHPTTELRNYKAYYGYKITQITISGGTPTVPEPVFMTGTDAEFTCTDNVDNDHDGKADDYDQDYDGGLASGTHLNDCDRAPTAIVVTPVAVAKKGIFRVRTTYDPAVRVYQIVRGRLNDEFVNYCINETKKVRSSNGRLYCLTQEIIERSVKLLRG
jgi:hypothetical protein